MVCILTFTGTGLVVENRLRVCPNAERCGENNTVVTKSARASSYYCTGSIMPVFKLAPTENGFNAFGWAISAVPAY